MFRSASSSARARCHRSRGPFDDPTCPAVALTGRDSPVSSMKHSSPARARPAPSAVDDAEAWCADLQRRGVEVPRAPEDTPWGRWFGVRDRTATGSHSERADTHELTSDYGTG